MTENDCFNLTAESSVWLWCSQQHFAKGIATVGFIFIWSRQTAVAPPRVFCRCLILCALPGEQHIDRVIQQSREELSDLPCLLCLRLSKCLLNDASAQHSQNSSMQAKGQASMLKRAFQWEIMA